MQHHNSTSRYYPVTKKDHERPMHKVEYCECADEGMDTHTHTSRYVPVGRQSKVTETSDNKAKSPGGIDLRSNWFGIHMPHQQI